MSGSRREALLEHQTIAQALDEMETDFPGMHNPPENILTEEQINALLDSPIREESLVIEEEVIAINSVSKNSKETKKAAADSTQNGNDIDGRDTPTDHLIIRDDDEAFIALKAKNNENGLQAIDLLTENEHDENLITLDDDIFEVDPGEGTSSKKIENTLDDDVILDDIMPDNDDTKKFSRLPEQMVRVFLEQLRVKDPEMLIGAQTKQDIRKLQETVDSLGKQIITMRALFEKKLDEVIGLYENKLRQKDKQLEDLRRQLNDTTIRTMLPPSRPETSFTNSNSRISDGFVIRRKSLNSISFHPYKTKTSPLQRATSTSSTSTIPDPSNSTTSTSELPNRILINVPLNHDVRQCSSQRPFDRLPPREYPIGLQQILTNETKHIELKITNHYDNFIISRKLHGQLKYEIPQNMKVNAKSNVRIYYLVESLHDSWIHSPSAKISDNGITKFSIAFDKNQKLYEGDRISFIAYLFITQNTKFVSSQVIFKMRRPSPQHKIEINLAD